MYSMEVQPTRHRVPSRLPSDEFEAHTSEPVPRRIASWLPSERLEADTDEHHIHYVPRNLTYG
jgi:hypothetical protein